MRLIYSGLLYLVTPFIPFYLKKRGRKNPDYLLHWNERFAINLVNNSKKPILWLHSVSVGETRAMQKLVALISENMSSYQILITVMTPTGRDTASKLYPQAIIHYLPYDLPHCVIKFYKVFKPALGIIMETEIWPNLIYYAHNYNIPLFLVNARLSDRSFKGYNRFKWVLNPILNLFTAILCQDQNTYNNFKKLGYSKNLIIAGNTKFDLIEDAQITEVINNFSNRFVNRKIICLASTRDGEEELLLDNLDISGDVLVLIIPRHPERFKIVEQLLTSRNIPYQKRSDNNYILDTTKVVIGDSLGEMIAYYSISYLAIIGGSFKEFGGQNPIEAISRHKPVIFGPYMFNFSEVASNLLKYKCGIEVKEIKDLNKIVNQLVSDESLYRELVENGHEFIETYQGASQKVYDIIKNNLVIVSYET